MNKSQNKEEFTEITLNLFKLILKFKDTSIVQKYIDIIFLYIEMISNKHIPKKEAKKIIEDIEGGNMFFMTLDHIFQQEKEKGKKEGEKEGELKGELKGEKQKAIEIAKELLEDGMPLEKISKITKLSIDEIEKIKTQMQSN